MRRQRIWVLAGLFWTTLATLCLEVLNTRLLSVLTWYHLSFFAVSVAMFGMAAGAVHVYLGGERFEGDGAIRALSRLGGWLPLAIALSHVANLCIPIPLPGSLTSAAAVVLATVLLSVPFYLSGLLVALVLTRIPGPIGLTYAVDLLGAALGALMVLPLLSLGDISSAVLACAALSALGAACFRRFAGVPGTLRVVLLGIALMALAVLNSASSDGLRVVYPKGEPRLEAEIEHEFWSVHGQVVAYEQTRGRPSYWGRGEGAGKYRVTKVPMFIDGAAGTVMTRWGGERKELDWVQHDVTSLPYHLRRGGDVAVVGVGGGRDILTALWAESRSVEGIEINRAFLRLLQGPLRSFANLADRPEVRLVHDEARSYLTRTEERFDVLQMSLIDTWAATGAGAFTLSENGLYTVEAWDVFLQRLKPRGILSVSRWFAPDDASETSRLISLATASLLRRGVADPSRQIVLVARDRVATLLVAADPFVQADLERLREVTRRFAFKILLLPGRRSPIPLLEEIVASRSPAELSRAVSDEPFDYLPPTDNRPFFFNVLRPQDLWKIDLVAASPGMVRGNSLATLTLLLLLLVVVGLLSVVIVGPLMRAGLPRMSSSGFALAVLYFGLIGAGFMLTQIGFMQRFTVYLGHPVFAVSVILFSMILATGLGSFLSDRVPFESRRRLLVLVPAITAMLLAAVSWSLQWVIESSVQLDLWLRCLIVVSLVAPLAVLFGMFFPLGMRLVKRLSDDALPWMWGVNGAAGVVASVVAVAISLWSGIQTNFTVAAIAYVLLIPPALILWRRGAEPS